MTGSSPRAHLPRNDRLRTLLVWGSGAVAGASMAVAALALSGALRGGPAPDPTPGAELDRAVARVLERHPEWVPQAFARLQQREAGRVLAQHRATVETPFAGAWAGAAEADVVLVEFFDYACPFCREARADVDQLLAEDPGLKVVFRDLPVLGPDSERFARAGLSAAAQGQRAYRAFLDAVFKGSGRLSETRLIAAVRQARLDEPRVAADLAQRRHQAELDTNLTLARALGLSGTPAYVVGDEVLVGAVGVDELRAAIARARGQAGA